MPALYLNYDTFYAVLRPINELDYTIDSFISTLLFLTQRACSNKTGCPVLELVPVFMGKGFSSS